MAKTDWTLTDTVKPDDFNDIGRDINQLREDVNNIEIPPASLTTPGITQLSNSTNSTSETMASTPKATKAAYDAATAAQNTANAANLAATTAQTAAANAQAKANAAETPTGAQAKVNAAVGNLANLQTTAKGNAVDSINELFTSASNGKAAVAAAITGKGVPASGSDTFPVLAGKIGQISTEMKSIDGTLTFSGTLDKRTISNIPFRPKLITLRVTLYRDAYEPSATNGFNFYAHFIASPTTPNYYFNGSVNSPIYGSHSISAEVNTTFGANSIVLNFRGAYVHNYQTVAYTIYGD